MNQVQSKEIISRFFNDSISRSESEYIQIDYKYREAEDNPVFDLSESIEGFETISRDDWMTTKLYFQLYIVGRIASTTKDRTIEIAFLYEIPD